MLINTELNKSFKDYIAYNEIKKMLTLMLLVANFANTKSYKKPEK